MGVLLAGPVGAPKPALPTPKTIISQIEAEGARAVLNRLWNDTATFDALCAAIETVDPAWLEVARRLKAGSDAGSSLSLDYSVARALPKAPERVLALVGSEFSVNDICTSPYIEPGPGVAENYQRRTIEALKKVLAPGLMDVRDQCLAGVSIPLKRQ